MTLSELPNGDVNLATTCPWMNCKDRFVVHWKAPDQKPGKVYMNGKYIGEGKLVIPPFKQMNGLMFLMIQRHMKEAHGQ